MRGIGRFAAKRATLIAIALLAVALLAGGSWALTGDSGTETPEVTASETPAVEETPETPEESEANVERYHGEDCTLATLEGDWSHGDYVSAVAKDDDEATNTSDAAQSRCGKPLNAGKDGEKKNQNSDDHGKPEWAGKGGRSSEHRPDGDGS